MSAPTVIVDISLFHHLAAAIARVIHVGQKINRPDGSVSEQKNRVDELIIMKGRDALPHPHARPIQSPIRFDLPEKRSRVASGHGSPDSTLWRRPAHRSSQAARLEHLGLKSRRKPFGRDQARSKRSAFITLVQAAAKSFTNFCCASAEP